MKCIQCNGFGFIDNLEGDGLICPKCNGTGEYKPFDTDVELDKLYPTIQTNEEWFCQLPTEEKAEVFANATYSTALAPMEILALGKEFEQKKWEMWLKQPHREE